MRWACRLAVEHNIHPDNEIWYGAPTFKQAKRVMRNRLKRNIPKDWIQGQLNNTECVMQMKTGQDRRQRHPLRLKEERLMGVKDPDVWTN